MLLVDYADFNTSNVTIQPVGGNWKVDKNVISIHLMLLFNGDWLPYVTGFN